MTDKQEKIVKTLANLYQVCANIRQSLIDEGVEESALPPPNPSPVPPGSGNA